MKSLGEYVLRLPWLVTRSVSSVPNRATADTATEQVAP
jgi:hypothetical protein